MKEKIKNKIKTWETIRDEYEKKLEEESKKKNAPTVMTSVYIDNLTLANHTITVLRELLE